MPPDQAVVPPKRLREKMRQQRTAIREELWPGSGKEIFDVGDLSTKGYTRAPRIISLVATLINELGGKLNAGSIYQALWGWERGEGFIDVGDPSALMYEAGYTSSRGRMERSWNERMELLESLGFVRTKAKGHRRYGYILLRDPYLVVLELEKKVPEEWLNVFKTRCLDLGIDLESYRQRLRQLNERTETATGKIPDIF